MTRSSTRRARLWIGVGALMAPAAVLAAAQPSHAALQANCHYVGGGPGVECLYGPGGGAFLVPAGITNLDITATGGSGGRGAGGAAGGVGTTVHNTFAVAAGNNIAILAGGKGGDALGINGGAAGVNGGAAGGTGGSGGGGGGGGQSGVTNISTVTILEMAGGGGGGGGGTPVGGNGGNGTTPLGTASGGSGGNGTGVTGGAGGNGGLAAVAPANGTPGGPGALTAGSGGGGAGGSTNGTGGVAGTGTGGGGGGGAGGSFGGATYTRGPANSDGQVTIRYTDPCTSHAVVSVGNASVVEGTTGDTPVLNFPITVTNASACSGWTLQVETEDGTATAGTDYTALPPTVVNINPGQTHIVVPVTVLGDTDVEQDETFRLHVISATPTQLSDVDDPANTAHLGDAVGTGTIHDDDDQIAECADNAPTPPGYNLILGTNGPDKLIGTQGNDIIKGFGGDDEIIGGHGDDILCGGDGYDEILGGAGDDRISGGEGNDLLIGGSGQDQIFGDGGINEIHQ